MYFFPINLQIKYNLIEWSQQTISKYTLACLFIAVLFLEISSQLWCEGVTYGVEGAVHFTLSILPGTIPNTFGDAVHTFLVRVKHIVHYSHIGTRLSHVRNCRTARQIPPRGSTNLIVLSYSTFWLWCCGTIPMNLHYSSSSCSVMIKSLLPLQFSLFKIQKILVRAGSTTRWLKFTCPCYRREIVNKEIVLGAARLISSTHSSWLSR